jgi:hypothetical protein
MLEVRFMRSLVALLSLAVLATGLPFEVDAGQKDKKIGCKHVIGTYLTKNKSKGEAGDKIISRSLISLAGAHLILFTDSGEGGEAGFAPFTDGRGSWQCLPGEGGAVKVSATTLDFTAPEAGGEGQIGRLDFDLTYDPDGKTLSGTATLYLIPLAGDPLAKDQLKDGREFAITGQRLGVR